MLILLDDHRRWTRGPLARGLLNRTVEWRDAEVRAVTILGAFWRANLVDAEVGLKVLYCATGLKGASTFNDKHWLVHGMVLAKLRLALKAAERIEAGYDA